MKKNRPGLWDNIRKKRARGERPARPGEKGYPKTLNIEGIEQARKNVGASKCWDGKKLGTPKTKMKGGKEVPNCVDEDYSLSNWRDDFKAMDYEFIDIIKSEPIISEECCPKCKKEPCECKSNGGSSAKPGPDKNYVKPMGESIDEATRIPTKTGNIIFAMVIWRGKTYSLQMFFPVGKHPSRKEVEDQVKKVYPECRLTYFNIRDYEPGQPLFQVEDWQKVNKADKTDGMSPAAVKAYRRENPGSKLKTAVTGDPKPGSKDANRRKSFCARSKGQQDMHNIDCSSTPDKPVCKARRRWKC